MKKRKLLFTALTVFVLTLALSVSAFAAESIVSGNYKYRVLDDDTVRIIAYLGKESTVNIPSQLDGKTVSALGFGLFSASSGTHTVTVPDSVVIMDGAIQLSQVKNVHLGAGVKKIRSSEFYGVKKLTVSQSNPNFASVDGVFYDKSMKELIYVPTGLEFDQFRIPAGVEKICDGAIVGVKMNSLVIPSTVKHIGSNAISVNGITSLVIPASVESMSMYAIYQCNALRSVKFENGKLDRIGSHVFEACDNLSLLSIPANIKSIGLFMGCNSLQQINVASANPYMRTYDGAVYSKDMKTLIRYPQGRKAEAFIVNAKTEHIDDNAFYDTHNNLKKIYIGENLKTIGDTAFAYSYAEIHYAGSEAPAEWKSALDGRTVKYNSEFLSAPAVKCEQKDSSIIISWSKVEGASGYAVYIRNNNLGKWEVLEKTSSNTHKFPWAQEGRKYTFAVRAYYNDNGKEISATDFSSVTTVTKPGITSKLSFGYDYKWIKLSWNKVTGATGYRVFMLTDKGWKALKTTADNEYVCHNLAVGTKYTFAVRAYTKYAGAYYWADKYVTIKAATAPLYTKSITSTKTAEGITLAWDKVEGATGYRVFRWDSNNSKWVVCVKSTNSLTANVSDSDSLKKDIFAVRAYINTGTHIVWGMTYKRVAA